MDYKVVRKSAADAFLNYKPYYYSGEIKHGDRVDNSKAYGRAMCDFYTKGAENPSVALMLMHGKMEELKNIHPGAGYYSPEVRYMYAKDNNLEGATGISKKHIQKRDAFYSEFDKLYPRTGEIRKQIIRQTKQSNVKATEPALDSLKKFDVVTNLFIETYPNTWEDRLVILGEDRLGKKGKMSKFKKFALCFGSVYEKTKNKGYGKFIRMVQKKIRVS